MLLAPRRGRDVPVPPGRDRRACANELVLLDSFKIRHLVQPALHEARFADEVTVYPIEFGIAVLTDVALVYGAFFRHEKRGLGVLYGHSWEHTFGCPGPYNSFGEETIMAIYVILSCLSPQAFDDPKAFKKIARTVAAKIKSDCPKVKWKQSYAVTGRFDIVDVVESPDLTSVERAAMIIRAYGHSSTETLVATPWDAFLDSLS